ncbi:MAG TPA: hypothetical protein VK932_01525 [Kofleriaceae bacterium]|nr:hypothetical protein [Kofleriaceae bacterium]
MIEGRRQHILRVLLDMEPDVKQAVLEGGSEKGRIVLARKILRNELAARQLTPSAEDDARIEACADLETLHRWCDQAVTAASVAEALA